MMTKSTADTPAPLQPIVAELSRAFVEVVDLVAHDTALGKLAKDFGEFATTTGPMLFGTGLALASFPLVVVDVTLAALAFSFGLVLAFDGMYNWERHMPAADAQWLTDHHHS